MTTSVEPHQFKAFISAMPSTQIFSGLVVLACRTRDKKLLNGCWCYFSYEFGVDYLIGTFLEEVEDLLTEEEGAWLWETIRGERQ